MSVVESKSVKILVTQSDRHVLQSPFVISSDSINRKMSFSAVQLKPSAGFVVKSTTLQDAFYATKSKPASSTLLEPSSNGLAIPKGLKVFVNIAWDANVPPPPEGSEDVIQKAMLGEDLDDLNPEGWYVPTVVSDGRQDTDKGQTLRTVV